jgi:hypothetical protein
VCIDLPVFVEDVPTYEVRSGRMHIELGGFAIIMPLKTFQIGCGRGLSAIKLWHREHSDGEVVQFRH